MRTVIIASALCALLAATAVAQTRILYLTKSSGFEHGEIKRSSPDELSHSEKIMTELAEKIGAEITCTKDASLINAENLAEYDVVIFYTTGDLTEPGTDGTTPMGENGLQELLDWIKAGGGFIGYHSANDTFHSKGDEVSGYVEMIGGEFETHGMQFKGTLRVVDPDHPIMQGVPDGWSLPDEWYISRNLNKEKMHVLALLDPGRERKRQPKYNVPSYPIMWVRAYGDGRVHYNALGHREDVWENKTFQKSVVNAIHWAKGEGPLDADPNYAEVVPKTIEESK